MAKYTDNEVQEMYEDMLDDAYGLVEIGNLTFFPSTILKKCDPIAYRIGLSEYADSLNEDNDEEGA